MQYCTPPLCSRPWCARSAPFHPRSTRLSIAGLRFSGCNMSPLYLCWDSNHDLLHFQPRFGCLHPSLTQSCFISVRTGPVGLRERKASAYAARIQTSCCSDSSRPLNPVCLNACAAAERKRHRPFTQAALCALPRLEGLRAEANRDARRIDDVQGLCCGSGSRERWRPTRSHDVRCGWVSTREQRIQRSGIKPRCQHTRNQRTQLRPQRKCLQPRPHHKCSEPRPQRKWNRRLWRMGEPSLHCQREEHRTGP